MSVPVASPVRIERGIPAPSHPGRGNAPKYPWHEMKVGDSFLALLKHRGSISGPMTRAAHRYGHVYTARTVEGGIRVWRTT